MRWLVLLLAAVCCGADLDQDGLPDKFEQQLLERFIPRFKVSSMECDMLPAQFARDEITPRVIARNGTLYGFVTPHPTGDIEMHYYHLWARDCGRGSHDLDVEHVSVLLKSPHQDHTAKHWFAVAWTASGHQGTICDAAHGVRAHLLDAAAKGPTVWISRGKHASFLDPLRCSRGCGGDRCDTSVIPWQPKEVLNLGSADYPMNGSRFVQSTDWALASKLVREFTPAVQTVLANAPGMTNLYPVLVPVKATVFAGGSTLDAVGTAESGVMTGAASVGNSLRKAKAAVSGLLNRW